MLKDQLVQFEHAIAAGGPRAGLLFLNRRVPHRCTAVYRVDGDNLQMVELIDKLANPATAVLPPLPLLQSFCQVAVNEGQLITSDSASERRLDNMPYQGVIKSYVGLPLSYSAGTLYGTLCHYDFGQQMINDAEFEFLQRAAVILAKALKNNSAGH